MKTRIRLTPFIYLGPIACVPMVLLGALLDLYVFQSTNGVYTITLTSIGFTFYLFLSSCPFLCSKQRKKRKNVRMKS